MPRTKRRSRKEYKKEARKEKKVQKRLERNEGFRFYAGHLMKDMDYSVFGIVMLLCLFGMVMVFSAGYYVTVNASLDPLYYLKRQGFWFLSGLVLMFISANFDYHRYYRFANILMVISIALLVAVLLVGQTVNGAQRWLGIGSFRITPSEFSKVFMIIFTSVYLATNPTALTEHKGGYVLFVVMLIHVALIVKQPNLSTAIVIAAIMFGIMFVAGLEWKTIGVALALAGGGTLFILVFLKNTHWYARLTNWMDPFADAQGEGYQVSQSLIALGNGGVKGLGIGKSIAKNLYLPEPTNDFILAIIGEELGYVALIILMAVYVFLLFRLIMIAIKAKDKLGFYLATGVAVMLGLQIIINVAVVTASMPATGITLPFISYGGASMWAFMIAIGISLNVSKYSKSKGRLQ